VLLGETGAALAEEIAARFDHVMGDEYQDTNRLQSSILLNFPERPVTVQASQLSAIAELRRWLERIESRSSGADCLLPFGIPDIDTRLPGGGLARVRVRPCSVVCRARHSRGFRGLFGLRCIRWDGQRP
jgi:hypothetical protein